MEMKKKGGVGWGGGSARGGGGGDLAGSSAFPGTSSSWLTAHSARTNTTTESPFSLALRAYTCSTASRPSFSLQFTYNYRSSRFPLGERRLQEGIDLHAPREKDAGSLKEKLDTCPMCLVGGEPVGLGVPESDRGGR